MLSVSLYGMRFHAPVGIFKEETILKNEIEINLKVSQTAIIDNLPFIDYSKLFEIVKINVKLPTELLETLIQNIVEDIKHDYPQVFISLSIKKINPPLKGNLFCSEVKWEG